MYAPILVMILFSFNAGDTRGRFTGLSLVHYGELFKDDMLLSALKNTFVLGILAALISTLFGTYAAIIISKMKPFQKSFALNLNNFPVVNPEIVTGISLMLFFVFLTLPLGFFTVLLAHISFCVPYVVLSVLPRLRQLNSSIYEAALDLGATPSMAFFKVVLPDLMPGITSGLLLAFTLSIDDFIISYFTAGAEFVNLSIVINNYTKRKIPLSINALSTLIFVIVFAILIIINVRGPVKETSKTSGR
jgi:spermidine/putrescine transport system permease protein